MAGTIPTHGAISLLLMQQKFGGSNPISATEYYRGKRVPSSFSSNHNTPQKYVFTMDFNNKKPLYYFENMTGNGYINKGRPTTTFYWNAYGKVNLGHPPTIVGDEGFSILNGTLSSYASKKHHGRVYHRGAKKSHKKTGRMVVDMYAIYYSSATTISNSHVPASGRISFSQWRGAHYK